MRIELQNYLKEKQSNITTGSLKFCPPPGSAPSERLFSTATHVLGSTRLRLKPENFGSHIFLKYNLRTLNGEKRTPPADFTPPPPPPTVADCHHMSSTRASWIRRTMRNLTLTSLMMKIELKQSFMMIDRSIDNILLCCTSECTRIISLTLS